MGRPKLIGLILLALACAGLSGLAGSARAAAAGGSNWAGYVASAPGVRFTSVSATWVAPAVACVAGRPTYMSSWVGLGGDETGDVEQIGTEADCGEDGQATYSTWLELVPSLAADPGLEVRPGDVISASVAVSGRRVHLRLANRTTGIVFTRQLTAPSVDVSSAEWVVEAPAVCADAAPTSCHASVLSNFGATGFSGISATAAGHRGGVADRHWSATAYTQATGGGPRRASPAQRFGAVPGSLSGGGAAFSISFAALGPAGPGQAS